MAVKKGTQAAKAEVKATVTSTAPVQAEEKKTAVTKKAETKKAETKKAETKKAETKKTETKKTETKKAAAKTAAAKPAAKRTTAKAELKSDIVLQFSGKSYTNEDLVKIAKDVWKYDLKKKVGDLKKVELYVKPEESQAYYVFNGTEEGSFTI